jgi:hypothetical protein
MFLRSWKLKVGWKGEKDEKVTEIKILYISSSFWLLRVQTRDFSLAEKKRTGCKAEQIHKMTTILSQKDNLGLFWVKIVVILWIYSALQAVLSFSA